MSVERKPSCLWVASDQPRAIKGRHVDPLPEEHPTDCVGCLPCSERHCDVCGREHVERFVCPGCRGETRDNLSRIGELCDLPLEDEAEASGIDSEALVLRGPVAHQEAWFHRRESALAGRIPADYLEDSRDERHPLFVLGTWELCWREWLNHETDALVTIEGAVRYLDQQIGYVSDQPDVPFADFARDVRSCLAHLEDVLHDSKQPERGAPCPTCREDEAVENAPRLVKHYVKTDRTGASDFWRCRRCKSRWTDAEYRLRVGTDYLEHAPELTITDMEKRTRVAAGTIRRWAASTTKIVDDEVTVLPPKLRHSGRTEDGRKLYRVADVLALRPKQAAPTERSA